MKAGKNVSRFLVVGALTLAATIISCGAQTNSHTKDESACDNDDWARKMHLGQQINDIIDRMDELDCGTEGDPMECSGLSAQRGHIESELSALTARCSG
ncbi:MAG: hypothetical protein AB7T49_01170 [Oligoflexales bacterium]